MEEDISNRIARIIGTLILCLVFSVLLVACYVLGFLFERYILPFGVFAPLLKFFGPWLIGDVLGIPAAFLATHIAHMRGRSRAIIILVWIGVWILVLLPGLLYYIGRIGP